MTTAIVLRTGEAQIERFDLSGRTGRSIESPNTSAFREARHRQPSCSTNGWPCTERTFTNLFWRNAKGVVGTRLNPIWKNCGRKAERRSWNNERLGFQIIGRLPSKLRRDEASKLHQLQLDALGARQMGGDLQTCFPGGKAVGARRSRQRRNLLSVSMGEVNRQIRRTAKGSRQGTGPRLARATLSGHAST